MSDVVKRKKSLIVFIFLILSLIFDDEDKSSRYSSVDAAIVQLSQDDKYVFISGLRYLG